MRPSLAEQETSERTFERLYRRHRGDVYRFVLRDLRNHADAEDVTQAAFLNAYRALQRGSEPEKPRAWLLTIAQNVTRRRFRSRGAGPREVELDPDAVVAPESAAPSAAEIREALVRLRPNQRAAIVLREIGGLSYAEVAETLGLSVSAVETLLFRSRRALREELAAAEERSVVRVGGLVLWPLPAALSDAAGSVATWLGRHGLTAKVAGALGATVIGTGAAVQAGAVPLSASEPERERERARPGAVVADGRTAGEPRVRPAVRAKATSKKAEKPKRGPDARPAPQPVSQPAESPVAAVEVPAVPLPPVETPETSVAGVTVPAVTVPPVTAPAVPAVPVPELPATPDEPSLPEPELPPLPDADELLP